MSFEPQNKLERSLMQAASDPAARPQFYKDLVEADLYIIDEDSNRESHGKKTLKTGEQIKIRTIEWNGRNYVPAFSSLVRLQATLMDDAAYLCLNSLAFLKIVRGTAVMLNPGSDYGKELTVEEIDSLIDGKIWQPAETFIAAKETRVLMGQPARYPTELADALSRYFKTKRNVKRAFLAHYSNPESEDPPHTLIAIECSGDWNELMAGAGMVAQGVKVPDPPIDFMPMTGKQGLEEYFRRDCKPFYERNFLGIF